MMAHDLNIQFSGRIGPLIGCLRNGKYYYRSRPNKVQQTKATQLSSNNFGLAAKAGKLIRLNLAQHLPSTKDQHMHKRLARCLADWLGQYKDQPVQPTAAIPLVDQFSFNPELRLAEQMKVVPVFSRTGPELTQLLLPAYIPATDIKAPAGTTHLEFCIHAVVLRLGDDACYGNYSHAFTIAYDNMMQDARQVNIALHTAAGKMVIASLRIRYGILQEGEINYSKWVNRTVAGIVGAIYV